MTGQPLSDFLLDLSVRGVQLWREGERLRCRAPQGVLDGPLQEELGRRKAEILSFLSQTNEDEAILPPITPAPAGERVPLGFSQEELWLADRLSPSGGGFKIGISLRLEGTLRFAILHRDLQELVDGRDALRTLFVDEAGETHQVVLPPESPRVRLALPLSDLSVTPVGERGSGLAEISRRETEAAFDLERGPLVRARLVRLDTEEHVLLVTIHHIVCDAWSVALLVKELAARYAAAVSGEPIPPPQRRPSIADFVRWQRNLQGSDALARGLAYWVERLDGVPSELRLPLDRPRPSRPDLEVASREFEIPSSLTIRLRALGRAEGVTLFMILLAAWKALLARVTGQEDIVVGTPTAGRPRPELQDVVGCFAYPLVLRTRLALDPTFRELLARVKVTAIGAFAHQDVPFSRVVGALRSRQGSGGNRQTSPLFNVMFTYPPPGGFLDLPRRLELPGLTLTPVGQTATTGYDLLLAVVEGKDSLHGALTYGSGLFGATQIERLTGQLVRLLEEIVEDPGRRIGEIALSDETGREDVCVRDVAGRAVPAGIVGWLGTSGASRGERVRRMENGMLERIPSEPGTLAWRGELRIDLRAIEVKLVRSGLVEDAAVRLRTASDGETVLVATVVPATPAYRERLAAAMLSELREDERPEAYVPVATLPFTADGMLDENRLASVPVLDSALASRWEAHLRASAGVEEACVLVQEESRRRPVLHLSELMPGLLLSATGEASAGAAMLSTSLNVHGAATADRPPAYASGGPLVFPPGFPQTLTEALQRTAAKNQGPEARGILYVDSSGIETFQSYADLLLAARRVLAGLRRSGLRPGDRVILQIDRLQDHFTAFWGCVLGGIAPVTVAVAPSYTEKNGLLGKLANTWNLLDQPRVLANASRLAAIQSLETLLDLHGLEVLAIESLLASEPATEIHEARPEDVVFLQLTSGSTGIPKCIQETHRGILSHAAAAALFNGYSDRDVNLNWLPVDHVVPILTCHLKDVTIGCQEIQVKTDRVLHEPLAWLDLVERHRVTHTWAPNFGFKLVTDALLDEKLKGARKARDLSSLKFVLNAGEQVTLPVVREFVRQLAPDGLREGALQPSFGMAEACTCMTFQNAFDVASGARRILKVSLGGPLVEAPADDEDSVCIPFVDLGPPVAGVDIRITDERNRIVSEGTIGRFQIRGAVITPGYLRNDEANREAFVGDGWFNSGDLGYLWDGRLTLTGREKETIIIRGANFYCYEIEDVVGALEGVEPTFVSACAVPDEATATEGLAIFFVPRGAPSEDELLELVRKIRTTVASSLGLAPLHLVPLTKGTFPKTTSGKIQRTQMKKALLAGEHRAVLDRLDIGLENGARTLPDWFYRPVWSRQELRAGAPRDHAGRTLVVSDGGVEAGILSERLGALFSAEILTANIGDAASALSKAFETRASADRVTSVVHLAGFGAGIAEASCLTDLVLLVQALAACNPAEAPISLIVVSSGSQNVDSGDALVRERVPLAALVRTIAQELPWLRTRHVDLPASIDAQLAATRLAAELEDERPEPEVAYRSGRRFVSRLERLDLAGLGPWSDPFRQDGFYLVSGGLGGVGEAVARYLVRTRRVKLLLIGRTELLEGSDAASRLRSLSRESERTGSAIAYRAADVRDFAALERALTSAREEVRATAPLDGVIHLAGAYREAGVLEETKEGFEESLAAKTLGAVALGRLLGDRKDALFVCASSVNGYFGGFHVGAYASGNRFLRGFVQARRLAGFPRSFCLDFSMWHDLGISRGFGMRDAARARGYESIETAQGIRSLLAVVGRQDPSLVEVLIGLDESRPNVRSRLVAGPDSSLERLTAFVRLTPGLESAPSLLVPEDRFGVVSSGEIAPVREIPRTERGEVDLERLRGSLRSRSQDRRTAEALSDTEIRVAAIWKELLGVPRVGVLDNFFELGGHSLLAARAVARINSAFSVALSLPVLFEAPSVQALSRRVDADLWVAMEAPVLAESTGVARDEGEI